MVLHFAYNSSRNHIIGLSLYGSQLPSNAPCVVYLHGFKGFKDWGFVPYLGEKLAENGLRMLAVNFSHNGIGADPLVFTELEKFKQNTLSLEVEEAQEIVAKYVRGKLFGAAPGAKIAALGHSRGGGIALVAFANDPNVKAITTWAAVSTFARYPDQVLAEWKEKGVLDVKNARTGQIMQLGYGLHEDFMANYAALNIRQAVESCEKPICIVQGEADDVVSVVDAQSIFEWATAAELHIIPDAGHTFGAQHPFEGSNPQLDAAIQHSLQFLIQQLRP